MTGLSRTILYGCVRTRDVTGCGGEEGVPGLKAKSASNLHRHAIGVRVDKRRQTWKNCILLLLLALLVSSPQVEPTFQKTDVSTRECTKFVLLIA